ncbi:hypothetical protein CSUI_009378, partial [Cystoisospora suis]
PREPRGGRRLFLLSSGETMRQLSFVKNRWIDVRLSPEGEKLFPLLL